MALLGKFVLMGNPGGLTWSSGIAKANNKLRGTALSDNMRVADARDGQGDIFATSVRRDTHVVTIDLIPFDADGGATLSSAKAIPELPDPGQVITLSDFGNPLFDGDWNYIGQGQVVIGDTAETPIVMRGLQLRRVAASGGAAAVQAVAVA